MKARAEGLPAILETPVGSIRALDESGMTFTLIDVKEGGIDLTGLFAGLPGGMCPIAHWGYVIEGAVHVRFSDGQEEEAEKGSVFYFAPDHIPTFDPGTTVIEIGPQAENRELGEHLRRAAEQMIGGIASDLRFLEPERGIEPLTSSLPWRRSAD